MVMTFNIPIGKETNWRMNFDSASSKYGNGAGIFFTSLDEEIIHFSYRLEFQGHE